MIRTYMASVPERPTNLAAIESCSLMNRLRPDQRELLASSSYMAYAERGEMVWMAGSPAEFVAVMAQGFLKMTKSASNGQEVAMELLGPGQCLGLLVAIEGRVFPLSAIAVTSCWYLKIPSRVLISVYQESREFMDQVVRNIGPRLRKAHDMMGRLSSGKVEERLAAILFILSESYGTTLDNGIRLNVPLTRQDLAEMAGTTVETTIRVLSRWHKDGIVSTERFVITIHDPDRLLDVLGH